MIDKKYIKFETEYGYKTLRDMARKGIGHSNLDKVAKSVKKKNKNKKK